MMIDDGQYSTSGYAANQQQPSQVELTRLAQAAGAQEDRSPPSGEQHEQAYDGQQQQQQQQPTGNGGDSYQRQPSTMDGFGSTSAYVGGAQINHLHHHQHRQQQQDQQAPSDGGQQYTRPVQFNGQSSSASLSDQATGPFAYSQLDHGRQQQHLNQQQAQHQAQLAELMNQQQQQYQSTTPLTLTTVAASGQEMTQQQAEQEARREQERQSQGGAKGYGRSQPHNAGQQQQLDGNTALLINPDTPIQMPILDQQSLIQEQDQVSHDGLTSNDDGASGSKQRQASQPAAVYQVYQAYYAPKDHKPLPGYVRLSLDEFNELFKDAEIQFVDKNLAGMHGNNLMDGSSGHERPSQGTPNEKNNQGQQVDAYESRSHQDHMRASGSELQSIVVDRRSISDRRSSNSTKLESGPSGGSEKKLLQLGQAAVKKIISIRSSRQAAKQAAGFKLAMKRLKSHVPITSTVPTTASDTTTTTSTSSTSPQRTPTTPTAAVSPVAELAAKKAASVPKKKMPTKTTGQQQRRDKPVKASQVAVGSLAGEKKPMAAKV